MLMFDVALPFFHLAKLCKYNGLQRLADTLTLCYTCFFLTSRLLTLPYFVYSGLAEVPPSLNVWCSGTFCI